MDSLKIIIQKYHILLLPIISVAISVAMFILIIVPQALKIPETNSEINQNRQTLSAINQKITDLEAIDLGRYQSDLDAALVALPTDKDIPGLLGQVEKYLSLSGMVFESVAFFDQTPEVDGTATVGTKVGTTGTKDTLLNLINNIKETPRIMKIDGLTIDASLTGGNSNKGIALTLNTFYKPPAESQVIPPEKPLDRVTEQNQQTLTQVKGFIEKDKSLFATGAAIPNVPLGKPDPFQ